MECGGFKNAKKRIIKLVITEAGEKKMPFMKETKEFDCVAFA